MENCTLPSIIVNKDGVRVVASGNTSVKAVRLESGAILVEVTLTGPGIETVTITETVPADAAISLSGNFDEVDVEASEIKVEVASGTVSKLTVAEQAAGSLITVSSGAEVNTLTLNAPVEVKGKGKIETANVNVSGSTIEQKPSNLNTAEGVSVSTGTSTTSSGGGGGGSSGSEKVSVSAISVSPKDLTLIVGETGQITATVSPSNATNKKVIWTTSNAGVATVDENGNVTAVAPGTATITATSDADSRKYNNCVVTVVPMTMSANDVEAITGIQFTMPVTTKGTVAEADKENKVRFYGVISGLAASDITFESIPGGTPAVITDETERGYAGASEGDLVLAWGPAGGFPLGDANYSGDGATTNFAATINTAGKYAVTFVFYDLTAGKRLNAAGEKATITVNLPATLSVATPNPDVVGTVGYTRFAGSVKVADGIESIKAYYIFEIEGNLAEGTVLQYWDYVDSSWKNFADEGDNKYRFGDVSGFDLKAVDGAITEFQAKIDIESIKGKAYLVDAVTKKVVSNVVEVVITAEPTLPATLSVATPNPDVVGTVGYTRFAGSVKVADGIESIKVYYIFEIEGNLAEGTVLQYWDYVDSSWKDFAYEDGKYRFGPSSGFDLKAVDGAITEFQAKIDIESVKGKAYLIDVEKKEIISNVVETTIQADPVTEQLIALAAVNAYLTPGKYVYAEAPGKLESHLTTLGLQVGDKSNYAALDKTATGGKNRKTAVFYDLNNNKPSEGYDLATLSTYFYEMVDTRLVTEASMDKVNKANNIVDLEGISFVTMLLKRFQTVSYGTHSDIPVKTKISTLQGLVDRYNALGEAGQKAVLEKVLEIRGDGFSRSQATTDALDEALKEMETEINNRLTITSVSIADNKAYASTAANGGTVRVLGYGVGINLDANNSGKKVSDTTSIVIELYKDETLLGQQTFNEEGYNKHGDKIAISGTIDAGGEYVATSWDNSWSAEIDQIPNKAVAKVQYTDGTAIAEKTLSFTDTKIFEAAEAVYALFINPFANAESLELKEGVTQENITTASNLVNAVGEGSSHKTLFGEMIERADALLSSGQGNGDGGENDETSNGE